MLLIWVIFITLFGFSTKILSEASLIRDTVKYGHKIASDTELPLIRSRGKKSYHISFVHEGSWYEALRFCRSHDMELLSFDTRGEEERFAKLLIDTIEIEKDVYYFWTSGNAWTTNNKWIWMSTGKMMSYSNLEMSDATNDNKKCLSLLYDSGNKQPVTWQSLECQGSNISANPICEIVSGCPRTIGKTAFFIVIIEIVLLLVDEDSLEFPLC